MPGKSPQSFTIGRLSRETGCKIPTIRYYEQIGLLPEPGRSAGNQRVYGQQHLSRLAFIRHSRELGFSQAEIRQLLNLADHPEQPCAEVNAIAQRHLDEVNRRIERLESLKAELERMVHACQGGKVGDCRVIDTLADLAHSQCLSPKH
ncbi:MerR family transcriptional regulator [Denitrobaculum tricleocarpae]|uniref:Helix-turn-helix domain-containing protein n=1 Tax=Denitrobaculum tricleocarpae TaxID=2591009 RepID=A0A545TWX9_9PROT|nr:helix-turn-helix domain-containing protein [Denitrobaculum tricleocarpae]TQV81719.1 helix-turn-helix domain-containing protein [Denitrobaculum tricleocarpae]